MKKLIAMLAVSVTAIAIAAADPVLVVHGFVNLNALGTSFEQASDNESTFGAFGDNISIGGGVGLNIPFAGYFGVQPGIDIYGNRVGTKNDNTGVVKSGSYVSLDIPLLLTAKVEKWNFQLGPYVSIPLGKFTYKQGDSGTDFDITSNAIVGMVAGIGYEERLGLGRLVFGARYMLDFMKLEVEDIDMLTRRGLEIDIGYKVPLTFFGSL